MYDGRANINKMMLEVVNGIAKELGTQVLGTVRRGKAVNEAVRSGVGLIEYDAKSNPAVDYMAIAEKLI